MTFDTIFVALRKVNKRSCPRAIDCTFSHCQQLLLVVAITQPTVTKTASDPNKDGWMG